MKEKDLMNINKNTKTLSGDSKRFDVVKRKDTYESREEDGVLLHEDAREDLDVGTFDDNYYERQDLSNDSTCVQNSEVHVSSMKKGFDDEKVSQGKFTVTVSARLASVALVVTMGMAFKIGHMAQSQYFIGNRHGRLAMDSALIEKNRPKHFSSNDIINNQFIEKYIKKEKENRMEIYNKKISKSLRDVAYYEGLVHPGMLSHPDPQRVAIIRRGRGGNYVTLREVLKHNTVENISLFGTDDAEEVMSGTESQEFSSCRNDCNDPRVKVLQEGFMTWFNDKFPFDNEDICAFDDSLDDDDSSDDEDSYLDDDERCTSEQFDAIIVNAENPKYGVSFEKNRFNKEYFVEALYDSLSTDGVLIVELGESPYNHDSPAEEVDKDRTRIIDSMLNIAFESMHIYEESHGGLNKPRSFLVVCKSLVCRRGWYSNEANINFAIHDRILRDKEGFSTLKYFDGATMSTYERPSKSWENLFCHSNPKPERCITLNGFDPFIPNTRKEHFEVKMSSLGENVGRGVFTTTEITKGTYIMAESGIDLTFFPPLTTDIIEDTHNNFPEADQLHILRTYMVGYGYETDRFGELAHIADSGISTFINHGCHGTYTNTGVDQLSELLTDHFYSEETANPNKYPYMDEEFKKKHSIFDPVSDRRLDLVGPGLQVSTINIEKGRELFENYLFYTEDEEDWSETVHGLISQCKGDDIGVVVMVDSKGTDRE